MAYQYGVTMANNFCNQGTLQPYAETCSFELFIKSFSELMGEYELKSPFFTGGPTGNHMWSLVVRPRQKVEGVDYLSVDLTMELFGLTDMLRKTGPSVNTKFQIMAVDSTGYLMKDGGYLDHEFTMSSRVKGIPNFCRTSDLFHPTEGLVGVDDMLILRCQIWITGVAQRITGCTVCAVSMASGPTFSYNWEKFGSQASTPTDGAEEDEFILEPPKTEIESMMDDLVLDGEGKKDEDGSFEMVVNENDSEKQLLSTNDNGGEDEVDIQEKYAGDSVENGKFDEHSGWLFA